MDNIQVINVRHEESQNVNRTFKNLFPSMMIIDILIENETISLTFLENGFDNSWKLENIRFLDNKDELKSGFNYDVYRRKQMGEKRVKQIQDEIKSQLEQILHDPKVRLRKIFMS